jgi:hypothetical protein
MDRPVVCPICGLTALVREVPGRGGYDIDLGNAAEFNRLCIVANQIGPDDRCPNLNAAVDSIIRGGSRA